ncbi:hypothetical protein TNCV_4480831 [Trichonephila clavipes]|nr:hypothetical protein TNCV_4480831 [Trichonephila clavipes]
MYASRWKQATITKLNTGKGDESAFYLLLLLLLLVIRSLLITEAALCSPSMSGHLRTLTFKDGKKVFPSCVRCSACQASPEHILNSAWGLQNKIFMKTL